MFEGMAAFAAVMNFVADEAPLRFGLTMRVKAPTELSPKK